ncbi:MAG: hypothetical protein JOZ78_05015 [Chroococcidiopsidaceae cyanobacterium CP_BM_ER_R8_30]|nr:hypothetical protein [Chroococcidiopsidaceae cyanobacterium CP_BM_ER_R8_30]
MTFIKVENLIINIEYIAAVKLANQTVSGEECISILLATPKLPLLQIESAFPNSYHYEWLDFTGIPANAIRNYFSSFNTVIDLVPQTA